MRPNTYPNKGSPTLSLTLIVILAHALALTLTNSQLSAADIYGFRLVNAKKLSHLINNSK